MKLDDSQPIYLQLADRIREQIVEGHLAEGEQVMSTTQFAQALRINPATAAKAFAELTTEGVLFKKRGIGMFVAEGALGRLLQSRRDRYFQDVLLPALLEGRRIGMTAEAIDTYVKEFDSGNGEPE